MSHTNTPASPRAHLVQLDIAWEDKAQNRARAEKLLSRAGVAPGDAIFLPEMFDSGFSFNTSRTIDADVHTLRFLQRLAQSHQAYVQAGRTIAGTGGGRPRNVMTVISPGGDVLAEYAKRKLFSPGGEDRRFERGDECVTWKWGEGESALVVMPAICYDLRFPELFREGLRRGAEVIALGACWPSVRHTHWRTLLAARAIENQCFVLGVNRVGDDPPQVGAGTGQVAGLHYNGGSLAVSPTGEVLGELEDREGVLSVVVHAESVRAWRARFGAWRDA